MSNNRNDFRPIVGIDLGTTNSAAGYIHKGKPELVQHADGQAIIPSVVLIDPSEKVVIGEDARSALIAMPDRTKAAVKREMGSTEPINLAGKSYVPEEVSALILKEIKKAVDDELGEGEKEAVITVPAYFTNEQRQATKKAGELAGFTVERIINEPTAAALAFGLQRLDEDRQLLVYDLGGGTFDVSVVEMMDGIMEVKASSGNSKLGGDDFDWLLVDALAEIMIDENGVDPREDVRGLALLKDEAESVKKQLSTEDSAEISLPVVVMKDEQPIGLYTIITRETFIHLISSLLQETMDKISEVLNEADLPPEGIDDILLVGGSTRIPQVHDLIADFFGKKPRQDVHPDEAIARGAAVQAGLKSGALSDSGLIVTDVAPFSMGIAVLKDVTPQKVRPGAYKAIIDKNTTIPVTRTERFSTSVPNQTEVMVEVYQGEEEWVKDNHFLNEFTLEGLPEGPAGSEAVDVTFRYNLNGILEVTAKSVSTGKEITVTLEDAIDRSSEEAYEESIESVKQASNDKYDGESLDFAQQDMFDFMEDIMEEDMSGDELLQEAERTKEHCQEILDTVSVNKRKQVKKVMETLTQAIHSQDADDLQEAIDDATDVLIDLEI